MDNQQANQTKDGALRLLGLTTRRARSRASPHVDFTMVTAGRRLLTQRGSMRALIVGTSGSANVNRAGSYVTRLEPPFVIDLWAGDHQRLALLDVVAIDELGVLVVDWRRRQTVFELVPALARLSARTQELVAAPRVIDLTEPVMKPTPTRI